MATPSREKPKEEEEYHKTAKFFTLIHGFSSEFPLLNQFFLNKNGLRSE